MSSIECTRLPNGIRVLTDRVPDVGTVALGVWVSVGTRHEDLSVNGVAHMVEHMLFKGTPTRTSQQIAEQVEDVGGQMNAYTSREMTSYHIHLLKDDVRLGLDILSDIVQRPTMPEEEVERERHVILQEIGMTHDTPDDIIFDEYQEVAFPEQGLGAPILGRPEIINAMGRQSLMDYVSQFYSPDRIIVSAAGSVEHENFVSMVQDFFQDLPAGQSETLSPARYTGGSLVMKKDLEQAHVILGFEGVNRSSDDYHAAQVLSMLMGGGMSSRLFQEIRERRGLVYNIYSFHTGYTDAGHFGIYAGTGPEALPEMMPVMCDEVQRLSATLNEEEIDRAKAQMRASLLMGRESMMTRADMLARQMIFHDRVLSVADLLERIEKVDINSIRSVADKIFASTPTLVGLGPMDNLESYEKTQQRLAA